MSHEVVVQYAAPQGIAVVRARVQQAELSRVVPAACGEVWTFARANNLDRPGRHVAVYLDGAMNIEVGVEVESPFAGNGRVEYSSTPSGRVATATHWGSYAELGRTHQAIRDWCQDQQLELAGPSWEIYGHWRDDPAQVRTDIFYLLSS